MLQKSYDWKSVCLILAGVYNIKWGAVCILFPTKFFAFFHMGQPIYPEFWQCIGMIVGVYGIGYLIASTDYIRHWPIILVGLIGKILGPIGFLNALYFEKFPLKFAINIVFNDLIWWIPFFLILKSIPKGKLFS